MIAQTATRRKREHVYRYGWYRCGFAAHKGPAVCGHGIWYRQEPLDRALLGRFHAAMTPPLIDALTRAVNAQIETALRTRDQRADEIKAEMMRLQREAGHLVRFLKGRGLCDRARGAGGAGGSPPSPQDRAGGDPASGRRNATAPGPPDLDRGPAHPARRTAQDEPRAGREEVRKHLDGDLTLSPLPSGRGERRVEISGRVKSDSLLSAQEAVHLQLVAGGRFGLPANRSVEFRVEVSFPARATG
jgi:hypothetical protein